MASTVAGAAIGLALILLARSLPRVHGMGLFVGLSVTAAAILAWTLPSRPGLVWLVYAVQLAVLAAWTFPWTTHVGGVLRLGMAWTGVSYWLTGALGAAVTGLVKGDMRYMVVSGQRLAYLVLAAVTVLAIVKAARAPGTSVTLGLVAAYLVTLGVLFIAGAATVFKPIHDVPAHAAAAHLENRFWGGTGIFYHPVSMAGLAVCVGARLACDRTLAPWQRGAGLVLVPLVVVLTQGRTAALMALAATAVVLVISWREGLMDSVRDWLPAVRTRAIAFMAAATLLAGCAVAYHRSVIDFFTVVRYRDAPAGEAADITSGRRDTWTQVLKEFRSDGWSEKLLGSAEHSRAVVVRPGDRTDDYIDVLIDSAALGALRRGGVVGAVAFVIGVGLLVRNTLRGGPRWFTVTALAALVTVPWTEWLLGSPLWLLLLAGEAAAAGGRDRRREEQTIEGGKEGDYPAR